MKRIPKRISAHHVAPSIVLRPIQALRLWQQVTLSEVRDDAPDLTMRQMAILLTIYLDPPPHTVRGLAARLDVTKPVITRALDTMGALKLVVAPSRRKGQAQRAGQANRRGRALCRAYRRCYHRQGTGAAALTAYDKRLHAFRPDLADARLKGEVAADRFVAGRPARIVARGRRHAGASRVRMPG